MQAFYENLTALPVSAATGQGVEALVGALRASRTEYERDYAAPLREKIAARRAGVAERGVREREEGEEDEGQEWSESEE